MGLLGIVANPASGKDVRRLVARASVFDNQEKQAIAHRALVGARAAGARRVAYLDDAHGILASAVKNCVGLEAHAVDATHTNTALDTISAARALKALDCAVVITLGGDGTNRAFACGWPDAPLVPLSTGTNNVFPHLLEGTVAGAAAGVIAAGRIGIDKAAQQQKSIRVEIDGERSDLALVDAVLSRERFVGTRALLAPELLDSALLTRADPAAVGITAIGGLLCSVGPNDEHGLFLKLGNGGCGVRAPIAPGLYQPVPVAECRTVPLGAPVDMVGPGVLAFDGERDRPLKAGQKARLSVARDGPRVVDVCRTLKLAAQNRLFSFNAVRGDCTSA